MEVKFDIEKKWEEIARKRREFMATMLEKAKEFEEMEVTLATEIRKLSIRCIRENNVNNEQLLIREDDSLIEASLKWKSILTLTDPPSSFPEFSKYVCRSLDSFPPKEFVFTEEKVRSAKAALGYFNTNHPDTPYTFVEMVAALRVPFVGEFVINVFTGHIFHLNFTARPSDSDGKGDSPSTRLFFASTCPRGLSNSDFVVETCCILDMRTNEDPGEPFSVDANWPDHVKTRLPSPNYLNFREEEEEEEEVQGRVKRARLSNYLEGGKPKRPQFFISRGVIHPSDENLARVCCYQSYYWQCVGCNKEIERVENSSWL